MLNCKATKNEPQNKKRYEGGIIANETIIKKRPKEVAKTTIGHRTPFQQ